jgi:hypothetical protein
MKYVEPIIYGGLFILRGLPTQTLFAYLAVHVAVYARPSCLAGLLLLPWETFLPFTFYFHQCGLR